MKYSLSTEHVMLGDTDLDLIEKKMDRLERFLKPPFQASVVLRHDMHHRRGDVITCRINIENDGKVYYAKRISDNIQNAIDETTSVLKKKLARHRDRQKKRRWWYRR